MFESQKQLSSTTAVMKNMFSIYMCSFRFFFQEIPLYIDNRYFLGILHINMPIKYKNQNFIMKIPLKIAFNNNIFTMA